MAYDDSQLLEMLKKKPTDNPLYQQFQQQIQNPVTGDAGGAFRFSPEYTQRLRDLQTNAAGLASQEEIGKRRLGEDYILGKKQIGENTDRSLKSLANRLAGQGIGRSSINIDEQTNIGNQSLQALDALGRGTARSTEDLVRQITGGLQELISQKGQADTDYARGESQWRQEDQQRKSEGDANREALNQQAQQFEQLKQQVLQQSQPQPSPTGQMQLPQVPQFPQIPQLGMGGEQALAAPAQPAPGTPESAQFMTDEQQLRQNFNTPMQIRALQAYLKGQGHDPGPIDGRLGPKTLAAWRAQQLRVNWSGVL